MRMTRVNITVPDDLLVGARAAGLNVSRLAAAALSEELDRRARTKALDGHLRQLEVELGSIPEAERRAAIKWADRALGDTGQPARQSAPTA